MFTKKHYKAIATIVREAKEDHRGGTPAELVLATIDEQLADYFAQDNERFDRAKFIEACGLS